MNKSEFETFLRVIDKIAPKYATGIFDIDDIKQEAYFLAQNAHTKFDPEKGHWEHFLSAHLSNRLKNFIRDNHTRKELDTVDLTAAHYLTIPKELWSNEDYELAQFIDMEIPANVRADYLKIKHGVQVNKNRRDLVFSCIKQILGEDDV